MKKLSVATYLWRIRSSSLSDFKAFYSSSTVAASYHHKFPSAIDPFLCNSQPDVPVRYPPTQDHPPSISMHFPLKPPPFYQPTVPHPATQLSDFSTASLSCSNMHMISSSLRLSPLRTYSSSINPSHCNSQHAMPLRYSTTLDYQQSITTHLFLKPSNFYQPTIPHPSTQLSDFSRASTCCSKMYTISSPLGLSSVRTYASKANTSSSSIATVSQGSDTPSGVNSATSDMHNGDSNPGHWSEVVSSALNSVLEFVKQTGVRVADAMHGMIDPPSGGAIDNLVSAGVALTACACAWLILPKVLGVLHRYVEQGPTARLLGRTAQEQVPYEMSVWSAMEDPARLFVTLVAFSQLGAMVAPSTVAIHYLEQIWRGGTVVSMVWFLHRWKSSAFARVLAGRKMTQVERERYLALDKFSSVGLIILGAMALAEASGVAVQSILTVGGIGGVATAFAARDILGNALSGLSLQFSKPFSVGDTISTGAIEGQVIEMGLHSTKLLNADKFPVIVPNSFFSSQVIVNKSRANWRGFNAKFPILFNSFEKLRDVTSEILEKLHAHPEVFLEKEPPRCNISTITPTHLELVVSCNIKPMGRDAFFRVQQEILISTAEILTRNGITLGSLH